MPRVLAILGCLSAGIVLAANQPAKPPRLLGYVEIKVWDTFTQREKLVVLEVNDTKMRVGHEGVIRSAAFSPDGKFLAVPAGEDLAKVWDLIIGKEVLSLTTEEPARPVQSVAFTPDGKFLLAADRDQVREWDLSQRKGKTLFAHRSGLVMLAPNAELAAGAEKRDKGTGVRIQAARTGQEGAGLATPSEPLALVFSPDGKKLAVASRGIDRSTPTLQVWDIAAAKEEMKVVGGFTPAIFAPDRDILAYWEPIGDDIVLWKEGKGTIRRIHHGHDQLTALAFSPDGKTLASAGRDRPARSRAGVLVEGSEHSVRFWDPASGDHLASLTGHKVRIDVLAYSADGLWLAAAGCEERLDPADKDWIDAHPLDPIVDRTPNVSLPKRPAGDDPPAVPPAPSTLLIAAAAFGVLAALILGWACWRVVWMRKQAAQPKE